MQLYIKYTLSTEGLGTECLNRLYRKSPRKPLELDCIKQSTEGKVNVNVYNNKNNKKLSYG